ncbi:MULTISPECIES: c-type cytochrome [Falsihalocynthiibacter]|uniref:c-type cytochrome n=1 Tax=Falsihalocynthiibacter TaxID=2854182 RepID=UPI003002631E
MKRLSILLVGAAVAISGATISFASTDAELKAAVEARQENMKQRGKELGALGAMLKGEVAYDAAAAQAAADALLATVTADQSGFWLPGTDSDTFPGSRAMPAIWAEGSKAGEEGAALVVAAEAMVATAGQGVDGIKASMGGVGAACSSCHKAYRAPKK